jgi:hypothetical protein
VPVRIFVVIGRSWGATGSVLKRRQDESDQASRKRSRQSGADCSYQVMVPFGYASHADRLWADGQAVAAHPPWDAGRQIHAVRRADEGARESDRRAARPRRSRNVPVKHFLDGLLVAHVPGVVRRGEYVLDCDLVPSCDRLEPEAFNVEREMVHQADAAPGRRKNPPPKIVGCKTSTASRTCSRCRFSAPRSTRCSADGSDGMTDGSFRSRTRPARPYFWTAGRSSSF